MNEELIQTTKQEYKTMLDAHRILDAVPLIRQAAHWGDLESQKLLADLFTNGDYGLPKDAGVAFEYTRLAALNGDHNSMLALAEMFRDGIGTRKDQDKAFYFFKKAAEAGQTGAYDPLALAYLMGFGTLRDLDAAKKWLDEAENAAPNDEAVTKHRKMLEGLQKKLAAE